MASPFSLGGFTGWTVDGAGISFSLNQNYPDKLEKFDSGVVSLLTPELVASFTSGDLIIVDFDAYSGSGAVSLACFDSSMALISSSETTLADGDAGTVQLAITSDTSRVRVTLSGAGVYISAIDIPGLAFLASPGHPFLSSIPADWVLEEGEFTFSHSPGVDSGDGNGSIMAASATGGQSAIKTHTFGLVGNEFYGFRLRLDDVAEYSAVNTHYEIFDETNTVIGGGSIADPPYDGRWMTAGFVLPTNASYIKIFVHGGPGVPIYIDSIRLPVVGELAGPSVAIAAAPSPIRQPFVVAVHPASAGAAAVSPLGVPTATAYHDFTGQLGDVITRYTMDLVTPTGTVRVPVSSWQATLQTGSSNYVQCVIPACTVWVGAIMAATEFVISRRATLPNGAAIEMEMARAPADQAQFDQGPQRHTCTLSGYSDAFAEDLDPPATHDRTLAGVRSISTGESNLRVRCAIDWLLRPGHRAYVNGTAFVVGYINYYAPSGFDAYMDAGSR